MMTYFKRTHVFFWILMISFMLVGVSGHSHSHRNDSVVPPQYPGGDEELFKDLNYALEFPKARNNEAHLVFCSYIINVDGQVDSIWHPDEFDADFEKKVREAIYSLKHWTPAIFSNRRVRTQFNIVVAFNVELPKEELAKAYDVFKKADGVEYVVNLNEYEILMDVVPLSGKMNNRVLELEKKTDHYREGINALYRKEYKDALKSLNRAYRAHPKNADVVYNRALAKFELGKLKKACIDWDRAHRLGDETSGELLEEHCGEWFP